MQITTPGDRPPQSPAACVGALLLIVSLVPALQGCVYRMPIQQGNFLDEATVAQIKPGMTRAQVRYLLGTPMVPPAFANDRWDYDYYLKLRRLQTPKQAHATVHFRDNVVERVDSDIAATSTVPLSDRPVTAPNP